MRNPFISSRFHSRLCAFAVLFLSLGFPAFAAETPKEKPPVEIEASHQLEWLRDQNKYRATTDVLIKQGSTTITGDNAEAEYDAKEGPSALTVITVTGNVVINDTGRIIHAEKAVYDTRTQILNLTGDTITLDTPQMNAVAHKTMDYNAAENKATATGNAMVKNPTQQVNGETITAWLEKDTNRLLRAEASGHVVITRKAPDGTADIARSGNAVYDADKNTAHLTGNVKMARGENFMQGDDAVIDMTTGHATLTNKTASTGAKPARVRAIFSTAGNGDKPASGTPVIAVSTAQ